MANDPRNHLTFNTVNCADKNNKKKANKHTVFDVLQDVTDLEIESKTLDRLRNVVKVGNTAQANTIVGDGVTWVFDNMGLNHEVTNSTVKSFNPGVANRALGAAKQIAAKAKAGDLSVEDIPQWVGDFTNLEKLLGRIFTPETVDKRQIEVCYPTHYAKDLIEFAPKYKFQFVVEFIVNEGYEAMLSNSKPAALCKQFDRPNPTFEYEDINMYGLRTKALKSVMYPPANMVFYDDGLNHVMEFFTNYLKDISPIANKQDVSSIEDDGLNFTDDGSSSASSRPPTVSNAISDAKTIFKEIRMYHIFRSGHYFNMYRFFNPKITELQFDDMSMEESQTTMITTQFSYDAMFIDTGLQFNEHESSIQAASELSETSLRYVGDKGSDTPTRIKQDENTTDSYLSQVFSNVTDFFN